MSVWQVAQFTIDTLLHLGMRNVCFIGGVACSLYTNHRQPKDVDILILDAASDSDQESIKRRLVEDAGSFYLVNARTPGATYKVLWYHPDGRGSNRRPGAVKVDILLPGTMDLPALHPSKIVRHPLPTAPLSLVLLHKLRGWHERIHSQKPWYYKRHKKDARDVAELLPIAARAGVKITDPVLPRKLVKQARRWVNEYITEYPECDTTDHWREIGFRARNLHMKKTRAETHV